MNDLISRQAAIDALGEKPLAWTEGEYELGLQNKWQSDVDALNDLPSAQPEQRYTEEELRVFKHGILLSLLSKRSSQHWRYDENTATEIEFLERLYEKVGADMRGEQE